MKMPWEAVIDNVKDLASEFITDKDKRIEFNYKLAELADREGQRSHETNLGQIDINKIEAASEDKFSRRWRPFVGWVCGLGLAYATIVRWVFNDFAALAGKPYTLTPFDNTLLMTVLLGMLGIGAQRSFDKWAKLPPDNAWKPSEQPRPVVPAGTPITEDTPVLGQGAAVVKRRFTLG